MRPIRTLLVDNYDSYTYNLYQLLAVVNGVAPEVVYNDQYTWDELLAHIHGNAFDNIVISPGPGTPANPSDIGLCLRLLQEDVGLPILGVCLGMQALGLAYGATVVAAPQPVHGRLSQVRHSGHPLFEGIPSGKGYEVVRYHSLMVDPESLSAELLPIAWSEGGHHAVLLGTDAASAALDAPVLMALAHSKRPLYGIQFHPESVATLFGERLLANFRDLTAAFHGSGVPGVQPCSTRDGSGAQNKGREVANTGGTERRTLDLAWEVLPGALGSAGGSKQLFWRLFSTGSSQDTFWLDSATTDRGRFSFMGGRGGALWRRITYKLSTEEGGGPHSPPSPGTVVSEDAEGRITTQHCNFWQFLEAGVAQFCMTRDSRVDLLPFDFWGGYVGYLGYELKAECGSHNLHRSNMPDAALFLCDRFVAVDGRRGDIYVASLHETGSASARQDAQAWIAATRAAIQGLARKPKVADPGVGPCCHSSNPPALAPTPPGPCHQNGTASAMSECNGQQNGTGSATSECNARGWWEAAVNGEVPGRECSSSVGREGEGGREQGPVAEGKRGEPASTAHGCPSVGGAAPFRLRSCREQYVEQVESCLNSLRQGESYELCLTTTLLRRRPPNARQFYSVLRSVNPAPYGAFLSFGDGGPQVCCSSPERFLRGCRGGRLEARPIKGTAGRHRDTAMDKAAAATLAASEKDRAENLMIVDLLRNDLGRVCEIGSVHVPTLMEVESYATVHQLVSTVRGTRAPGVSTVSCIKAAFPGGSMTGAPKLRSIELLDRLEKGPRGIYSGSIGFISFNDAFDLNIVIRTAVFHDGEMSIGAGGAIVVQSDPEAEYEEMRLKAHALLKAVGLCDGDREPAAVDDRTPYQEGG